MYWEIISYLPKNCKISKKNSHIQILQLLTFHHIYLSRCYTHTCNTYIYTWRLIPEPSGSQLKWENRINTTPISGKNIYKWSQIFVHPNNFGKLFWGYTYFHTEIPLQIGNAGGHHRLFHSGQGREERIWSKVKAACPTDAAGCPLECGFCGHQLCPVTSASPWPPTGMQ